MSSGRGRGGILEGEGNAGSGKEQGLGNMEGAAAAVVVMMIALRVRPHVTPAGCCSGEPKRV